MKTLVVSILLVTAFFTDQVMAVSRPSDAPQRFAYNYEMNDGRIVSETIFKVEAQKYLHQHLKYSYTYDAEGHLLQKEVLKWNPATDMFEKYYCLNFAYADKEVSIEHALWNPKQKAYMDIQHRAVYQLSDANVAVNYMSYKWNGKDHSWDLELQHPTMDVADNLIADK